MAGEQPDQGCGRKVYADAFILLHLDEVGIFLAKSRIGRGYTIGRDIKPGEQRIASRMELNTRTLASPGMHPKRPLAACD